MDKEERMKERNRLHVAKYMQFLCNGILYSALSLSESCLVENKRERKKERKRDFGIRIYTVGTCFG